MNVYFLISCKRCKWFRKSTGLTEDLKDLVEIKKCNNCGGVKKFKCPKCSNIVKALRVNSA